jgi:methyl-accepting chemotaxis protein
VNIRQKLLLGAAALTVIPVVLTAAFLWAGASGLASNTVNAQTQSELISIREARRQALIDEFNGRVSDVSALAAQRSTLEAFRAMRAGYATAARDLSRLDPATSTAAMNEFVQQQFRPEYLRRNADAMPDLARAVAARDANSVALQAAFITSNPNPLGQKDKLVAPAQDFAYGKAHALFHPGFERVQKLQSFYDLFLVDVETDNVVYTVFKELDFATNLSTGISANTKLSEAYQKVKKVTKRDTSYLSDFAPYLVSYNDQAAFIGVPLFDGDQQVAVLLAQYPIDKISDVMSSGRNWKKVGLGETGDVFVVGQDKKMRSNARYLLENKDTFTKLLADKVPGSGIQTMVKKESSIGIVTIDSDATRPALSGEEGFIDFVDYRGIRSFGAYAPLVVQGLNWGRQERLRRSDSIAR